MKNDLNHIDEVFKNSFENFETNVDPSVWTNVQQGIGSGGGATPTAQQPVGAAASSVSKSLLFYAAASIVATATILGSVYLLNGTQEEDKAVEAEIATTMSTLEENNALNVVEEINNESDAVDKSKLNSEENIALTESPVEVKTVEEDVVSGEHNEEEIIASVERVNTEEVNNTISETTSSNNSKSNVSQPTTTKSEVIDLKVSIDANIKKGKAPLDVEFGVSGNGVSYLWDFGDNSSISSEENPYHTFKEPGTYKVTLTAIDKNANPKTSYQLIVVEKNSTSHLEEVKNVFSPNGDGINDVIKVEGKNIRKFHAVIMDSKGKLIYEWDSIDGFWDGRDNSNNIVPKGTYYIAVTAVGEDGKTHTSKKSIQLY